VLDTFQVALSDHYAFVFGQFPNFGILLILTISRILLNFWSFRSIHQGGILVDYHWHRNKRKKI